MNVKNNEKFNNILIANIVVFILWAISMIVCVISACLLIKVVANTPGNSGGDVVNEIVGIIKIIFSTFIVAIISFIFWIIALISSIVEIVFAAIALNKIEMYKKTDKMWCFWLTESAAAVCLLVVALYRLSPLVLLAL